MEQSVTLESFKNSLTRFIGTNNSNIGKQYLLYYLRKNWSVVAGKFSNHCWPATISEGRLIVGVDNAPLANQLFMVKTELVKKVNQIFQGKYILRDMSFKSGLKVEEFISEKEKEEKNYSIINCPKCGGKMESWRKNCFECDREVQSEKREKLKKELKLAPWIKYEQITTEDVDKLTFNQERDILANYYYEKIRRKEASEEDKIQAVLFYTKKLPVEISAEENKMVLAILAKEDEYKELEE
ncbi:MAG: DUF721 domain-containing protein [Phascolarctobacterium sp.]|nr:DUF721 domain-containing protein [Phascolarctobacterium sp.]